VSREATMQSFAFDRGGMLVRSVTPSYGPKRKPYEHRCSQQSFEAVAHAIDEIGDAGFGLDELVQRAAIPHSQAATALAFMKDRGCVITENKRNYPATGDVYLDAMIEWHALREKPAPGSNAS
jgi:hypothetical protein